MAELDEEDDVGLGLRGRPGATACSLLGDGWWNNACVTDLGGERAYIEGYYRGADDLVAPLGPGRPEATTFLQL